MLTVAASALTHSLAGASVMFTIGLPPLEVQN